MPTLGGNDTLRGFREYRSADRMRSSPAEYAGRFGADAALFYDAGKVANRREDLDFENLESDYGIGFRFNTNSGVILRVDAAFGIDGKHLYIVFGGVFSMPKVALAGFVVAAGRSDRRVAAVGLAALYPDDPLDG